MEGLNTCPDIVTFVLEIQDFVREKTRKNVSLCEVRAVVKKIVNLTAEMNIFLFASFTLSF